MIYYLSTKESQLKSSQLRVPKQLLYSSVINVEVIVQKVIVNLASYVPTLLQR